MTHSRYQSAKGISIASCQGTCTEGNRMCPNDASPMPGGELFDIYSEQDFWGQAAGVAQNLKPLALKKMEHCWAPRIGQGSIQGLCLEV